MQPPVNKHYTLLCDIDAVYSLEEICRGKHRSLTENDSRRWMRWCQERRCREIQSLTVRQIVPLATRCPFNFSACWLIAKEHCLSQRESNLACLPGYSSAKAPPVMSLCSWRPAADCFDAPIYPASVGSPYRNAQIRPLTCPSPWKLEQYAHGNGKKWDRTISTNENQRGIVTHFNVMQLDVHFHFPSPLG